MEWLTLWINILTSFYMSHSWLTLIQPVSGIKLINTHNTTDYLNISFYFVPPLK